MTQAFDHTPQPPLQSQAVLTQPLAKIQQAKRSGDLRGIIYVLISGGLPPPGNLTPTIWWPGSPLVAGEGWGEVGKEGGVGKEGAVHAGDWGDRAAAPSSPPWGVRGVSSPPGER